MKRCSPLWISFVFGLLTVVIGREAAASPTCVTIQRGQTGGVADAALLQSSPASPQGAVNKLYAGVADGNKLQRSLLRFDLSSIPANSTVNSATLTIYETTSNASGTVNVHLATTSWSEAAVTWNSFGSSFAPAIATTFAVTTAAGFKTVNLQGATQGWVSQPANNYGILLEAPAGFSAQFRSSEYITSSYWPKLDVCYTVTTDADGDGYPAGVDCDDNDPNVHPGAVERCDGKDNDCNGQIDDGADAACDDHDACNGVEHCQAGSCGSGQAVVCAASDQCHAAGVCDPATGACSNPAVPDGVMCNDADACTIVDHCTAGVCAGTVMPCFALDACHATGVCDPATGQCSNPAASVGTSCTDGNVCNGIETCDGQGHCLAGIPLVIDDGNPCTSDACDPVNGISHVVVAAGTPCGAGTDACHPNAVCDNAGTCGSAAALVVDDGDPCTLDSCDPVTGPVHVRCQPIDPSVSTTVFDANQWIYTGPSAVQTGVSPGRIVRTRAALITGSVIATDGAPLAGVSVSVLGHPELGTTTTLADGSYQMVVNGGSQLVVSLQAPGFIPAERSVHVPWEDYAAVPTTALVAYDPAATVVGLGPNAPFQVARGSISSDASGSRQATVLFPVGTTAQMLVSGQPPQPLGMMTMRATEFTVGAHGPDAMPASLPPASAYTYAFELSADEAVAAGATSVVFNQPVVFYVDNFLHFPAGTTVPVGYYDRSLARWVPSASGVVIAIVGITNGLADVDSDGDGLADAPATLAARGITTDERQAMASLYAQGDELWRVSTTHFTAFDCNWGFNPPNGACAPFDIACLAPGGGGGNDPGDPHDGKPTSDPCNQQGSIIECENQTLGESVAIPGTAFHVNYRSDRVAGRTAAYTLDIPLGGQALPASLKRIDLEVDVAGRQLKQTFACPCSANGRATITWDGTDRFGRSVNGAQPATVRLGYVYDGVYGQTESFGDLPKGALASGDPTRQEVTLSKVWVSTLGPWVQLAEGLGGWSVDVHHAYDPASGTLYLGDGSRVSAAMTPVIETVAGCGAPNACNGQDGSPATSVRLKLAAGVAVAPDGAIYVAEAQGCTVRRVDPVTHLISTVAGAPPVGPFCNSSSGDGGPATSAQLNVPRGIAIGRDGSLYIAEQAGNRIRRVDPSGVISTVAGTGAFGFSGDGGPATQARIWNPFSVAVAPDGTLYFTDMQNARVRRVRVDGVIDTVAGNGVAGFGGDGGPAAQASLNGAFGVAVGDSGVLYIADTQNQRVREVGLDGTIKTLAGTGVQAGSPIDGGLASQTDFSGPTSLAVGRDGSVYVGDFGGSVIRRVAPSGIVSSVTGPNFWGPNGDQGPAFAGAVYGAEQLAIGADNRIYVGSSGESRVRRIGVNAPTVGSASYSISSRDGTELFLFDQSGRHLRTVNTLTGRTSFQFSYDASGRLATITDARGQVTTIQHDAHGNPTSIVGEYGQATTLATDANGYLSSVINANGEATLLTYSPLGLLGSYTDPKGQTHSFNYDPEGRLARDADPAGGFKQLDRFDEPGGHAVTVTTAMGRSTTYHLSDLATGEEKRSSSLPDGTSVQRARTADLTSTTTLPDGTTAQLSLGPDPRFGMLAPFVASSTTRTPTGKTRVTTTTRNATLSNPQDPLSLVRLTEVTSVNGRSSTSVFDRASLSTTRTSPLGRQITTKLDAFGQTVELDVPTLSPVQMTYDGHGKLLQIMQGSRVQAMTHDGLGHLSTATDAMQQVTSFTSDLVGRLTSATLPDHSTPSVGFDANGDLAVVAPVGQPTHALTYDGVDLLASYTAPNAGSGPSITTYNRDLDHLLSSIVRPDGMNISYSRDAAGRLSAVTLPAGQGAIGYTYDPKTGQLTSTMGPGLETVNVVHDGALLTDMISSGSVAASVHRGFDNDFRVVNESVNGSNGVGFSYDGDGLLIQAGGLAITHHPQSGALTGTALGVVSDTYSYDAFGDTSQYAAAANGSAVFQTQYQRDNAGRIIQLQETLQGQAVAIVYAYDAVGRLTDVSKNGIAAAHYDYDTNGNRLSRAAGGTSVSGIYDAQDRLLSYGTKTYGYTASGELATAFDSATGQTTSYTYDALGSLRSVVTGAGAVIDYEVDGFGRRVQKRVNGVAVQGFVYGDGLSPLAELDGNGNVVARFVYALGRNVPNYMVKGGSTYRIVTDHLGSPRLVIDVSTGTVVERVDYDEFGVVTNDTNAGFEPYGFAGGLYDRDTRLVRFGARDYDAETGRWTAKDPLWFGGGQFNLFVYVGNDPVNQIDPTGHFAIAAGALLARGGTVLLGAASAAVAATGLAIGAVYLAVDQAVKLHREWDGDLIWKSKADAEDTCDPEQPKPNTYRDHPCVAIRVACTNQCVMYYGDEPMTYGQFQVCYEACVTALGCTP